MSSDSTALWMAVCGRKHAAPENICPVTAPSNCARWEDPKVFTGAMAECRLSEPELKAAGTVLMSDGKRAYMDSGDSHTLVFGTTGSMKTRRICMPTLEMYARAGESVVVADPKGELYDRLGNAFISRDYAVQVINLRDPMKGVRWNPLEAAVKAYDAGDYDTARSTVMDLAYNLIPVETEKDPYWESSAQMLFYGLAWYLICTHGDKPVSIEAVVREMNRVFDEDGAVWAYNRRPECSGVVTVKALPESTRRCVLGVFQQKLWNYVTQSSIVDMMSGSDVDMGAVGDRKTALFLIVPDEKNTYNALVSVFVKQLYTALIARSHELPDGRLPVRVNYLLDEFANFPKIPAMQNMITASRSRNIRFTLVVQTEKQLRAVYGRDADAIRDNCLNWVFLNGRDIEFMETLCKLIGKGPDGKALITVSGLQRLEVGEALVLCRRMNPIITRLADIDEYAFRYEKPVLEERPRMNKKKEKRKKRKEFDMEEFEALFGVEDDD